MSDLPQPQQDKDAYWQSGKEFVRLLIAELNQALNTNRISTKKRREICTSFTFAFCNFVDQEWFRIGGATQYPLLCFSREFFDLDSSLDLSKINFPHKSVELHGMVHDEVKWFFDEVQEDAAVIITGNVGAEIPDSNCAEVESDSIIPQPCWTCKGTGHCFCIRKGGGDPTGCFRCQGTGQCRHCHGTGKSTHA